MFKPQSISSTEARKYFSQIINKVQFSSKSFVVQSYRKPAVRVVKEEYIAILEQVLGKKTVGEIMQIAGNDNMREATKAQEIRKVLQRRLSGGPRPQPRPKDDRPLAKKHQSQPRSKPNNPQKGREPLKKELLLQNGKNY